MAKRRTRKKDDPAGTLGLALLFGTLYAGWSANWGLLGLLLLVLVAALAGFILRGRRRQARALALRDLQALTPRQLELHVAQVISALPGWRAEATRGSSDQGADVIAVGPGGVRVAVQVKHYRNNVGNAAVQEIVAAGGVLPLFAGSGGHQRARLYPPNAGPRPGQQGAAVGTRRAVPASGVGCPGANPAARLASPLNGSPRAERCMAKERH
ncbi:restriction endonuclease [Deinococcus petrolearius]|uniref:Restriction endonuclease n=1 Tax=Deinococcus petrolearius TaxID=1751295 RepID=A0ABW1DNA9_9DEIO